MARRSHLYDGAAVSRLFAGHPGPGTAANRRTAVVPAVHNDVVIKGGTILTVTHGKIENGSILIHDGKIAAVGQSVNAPANATVIDASGKFVMPGIIDSHSHIALDDDVNEPTSPITPHMMMHDAFDYNDKAIYRALAGGVTTSLLLHGSANMIGGQAIVIKHKYGLGRDELIFPGAPQSIKFASGENPSAFTAGRNQLPSTRMGKFEVMRAAFIEAREYMRTWDDYDAKVKKGDKDPRRRRRPEAGSAGRHSARQAAGADPSLSCRRVPHRDGPGQGIWLQDPRLPSRAGSLQSCGQDRGQRRGHRHLAGLVGIQDEAWDGIPWNAVISAHKGVRVALRATLKT